MRDATSTFLVYYLPAILYAAAILTLSSLPDLHPPRLPFARVDKLAHFLEYSIFAVLIFRAMSRLVSVARGNLAYVLSLLLVSTFAAFDETYQSFIPGRHTDAADLLVDIVGAFLVLTFLWLRRRRLSQVIRT
jgi:VanZ family protein